MVIKNITVLHEGLKIKMKFEVTRKQSINRLHVNPPSSFLFFFVPNAPDVEQNYHFLRFERLRKKSMNK